MATPPPFPGKVTTLSWGGGEGPQKRKEKKPFSQRWQKAQIRLQGTRGISQGVAGLTLPSCCFRVPVTQNLLLCTIKPGGFGQDGERFNSTLISFQAEESLCRPPPKKPFNPPPRKTDCAGLTVGSTLRMAFAQGIWQRGPGTPESTDLRISPDTFRPKPPYWRRTGSSSCSRAPEAVQTSIHPGEFRTGSCVDRPEVQRANTESTILTWS